MTPRQLDSKAAGINYYFSATFFSSSVSMFCKRWSNKTQNWFINLLKHIEQNFFKASYGRAEAQQEHIFKALLMNTLRTTLKPTLYSIIFA